MESFDIGATVKMFVSGESIVLESGINTVTVTFEELGRVNGLVAKEVARRNDARRA